MSTMCPECGAPDVRDSAECDLLFKEVVGQEFSQPALFGVHRLTVDAYSLQHPEQYMRSTKSAAAHLAGMCWSLEFGGGPSVSRALSGWLDGAVELPRDRGDLTIRHVHEVQGSAEHVDRVKEWAESVWAAWEVGHVRARELGGCALGKGGMI